MADLDEVFGGGEIAPVEKEKQPPVTIEEADETLDAIASNDSAAYDSDGVKVPVAALQKEREKAKRYTEEVADLRRQIADQDRNWQQRVEQLVTQLQPKQPELPAVNYEDKYWESPVGTTKEIVSQAITPIQQALMSQREGMSRMIAAEKHGEEAVNEAFQALATLKASNSPEFQATYEQVMSSPHPYGALVKWNLKREKLAKIGDDPDAFIEQEVQRRLSEQANGGPQQTQQPQSVMPSNFATARNVGSRAGPAWTGPKPLTDIFKT